MHACSPSCTNCMGTTCAVGMWSLRLPAPPRRATGKQTTQCSQSIAILGTHRPSTLAWFRMRLHRYLTNPLGLDKSAPRFQWVITDSTRGVLQASYRISVGTDAADGSVWDSGVVTSAQTYDHAHARARTSLNHLLVNIIVMIHNCLSQPPPKHHHHPHKQGTKSSTVGLHSHQPPSTAGP
jgi:hypothetical protein